MTVKKLKELLSDTDDNMEVFIMENPPLGGFLFIPVCENESGVVEFGPPAEDESGNQGSGFILARHGQISHDEEPGLEEMQQAFN